MNGGNGLAVALGGYHGRSHDAGDGVEEGNLAAGSPGGDESIVEIEGRRCDPTILGALRMDEMWLFRCVHKTLRICHYVGRSVGLSLFVGL